MSKPIVLKSVFQKKLLITHFRLNNLDSLVCRPLAMNPVQIALVMDR